MAVSQLLTRQYVSDLVQSSTSQPLIAIPTPTSPLVPTLTTLPICVIQSINLITFFTDLNRYCLPNLTEAKDYLMNYVASGNLGRYIGDLGTAWYIYLIMAGISLVLCLIFLILLRYITAPLLYISFVLIFFLLLGGGFYVYYEGNTYDGSDNTRKIMHGMGILCWILTGVYFIILLCCCSRIRLGVAIMEAASDFVKNTPSVFTVPFTFFFILGAWVVFWVFSAVYVFSVGDVQKRDGLPMA